MNQTSASSNLIENHIDKSDRKVFETFVNHYHNLFAFHAAQRLTTFNFFLLSLTLLSNAYALFITRGAGAEKYLLAGILAVAAFIIILLFDRLDARNEQIIHINEKALMRIQCALSKAYKTEEFKTFQRSSEEARTFATFGAVVPSIYRCAFALATAGAVFAFIEWNRVAMWDGFGWLGHYGYVVGGGMIMLGLFSSWECRVSTKVSEPRI